MSNRTSIKLALAALALALPLGAQTTVAQTIRGPNGLPANGQASIKISAPCSWGSSFVGTTAIKVSFTAGNFTVPLVPNDACITALGTLDTTYIADFLLTGGTKFTQTWTVKTSSAPLTVNQVNGAILADGTICFQATNGVLVPATCIITVRWSQLTPSTWSTLTSDQWRILAQ